MTIARRGIAEPFSPRRVELLQEAPADEGVSFQQLLLDARRELARHYLLQPSLELNEAAYLLGCECPTLVSAG